LYVFAAPLVMLVYQGGIHRRDSQRVAMLLQVLPLAVPAWIRSRSRARVLRAATPGGRCGSNGGRGRRGALYYVLAIVRWCRAGDRERR